MAHDLATPRQTEGPFYPDHLPLDTDNDLLVLNKWLTPPTGEPIRNAQVEIWQVDNSGAYIHSRSGNTARRDPTFQGFGRFLTGSSGEYLCRTIKPVAYPGRTRHIHMAVLPPGGPRLVTQVYVAGEPGNERDMVLRGIRGAKARASVIVPFSPLPGSKIGELTAKFDVVLGFTPPG